MATVTFALDKRKNSKSTAFKVAARVRMGRKAKFVLYPFETKVEESKWDPGSQRMRGTSREAQQFNIQLSNFRTTVSEAYLQLEETTSDCRVCSKAYQHLLKFGYLPEDAPKPEAEVELTIIDLVQQYINESQFAEGTVTTYQATISHLKAFSESAKMPLQISRFSAATFNKFRTFLVTNGGMINDTANKYLKKLKAAINWHIKYNCESSGGKLPEATAERLASIATRLVLLPTKPKKGLAFTEAELTLLNELDLSSERRLDKARDLAIFTAWTGVRVGDLVGSKKLQRPPLRKHNIDYRRQVLTYLPTKTQEVQNTEIALNKIALDKLLKYQDLYDTYILPVMSAQKANEFLTEIMEVLAGLHQVVSTAIEKPWEALGKWKNFHRIRNWFPELDETNYRGYAMRCKTFNEVVHSAEMVNQAAVPTRQKRYEALTFHSLRRFLITYLLENGATLEDTAKMVGHSDIKTTKIYDCSSTAQAVERGRSILANR